MSVFSVDSAAQWVGKLLAQEVEFLAKVRDKVEILQSEMHWMRCFLQDADHKQNKSVVRKWVSEIRDLAYESEDVIEKYILEVSHKREKPEPSVIIPWTDLKWLLCCWGDAKALHIVGCSFDDIVARIKQLNLRLNTYGLKSSHDDLTESYLSSERRLIDQRRTYSHVEDDAVGLNEDVMDKLAMGEEKVVVIHGMGGIGKTTLARKVYHHANLMSQFDGFAWAYVSQQLQLTSLCREILLQLIPANEKEERTIVKELEGSPLLITKLHQVFKSKKCLVVMDDIWSTLDWKKLEPAFAISDDSCRSKIVVTTRNPQILPTYSNRTVLYHEVQLLSPDKSWELFQKKSTFNKDDADPSLVDLGEKMLGHCNGLPLAIVVLGGILATKKTYEEWQDVYGNLSLHQQEDELYSGVYGVLAMSYYELPYYLKACFLHLGYFPEDFNIPLERLYHLWIAEGIVSWTQDQARCNRSMEDIAKVYLNELVQRGMVQVTEWHYAHEHIQKCRLHDLMRDKCLEIAKDEIFLQTVDHYVYVDKCNGQQQTPPNYALDKRLRRLAIYVGHGIHTSFQNSSSPMKASLLRSILFFPINGTREEDCKWIGKVTEDYQLLRILDFTGLPLTGRLPKSVGNLIYLRYLSLWNTRVTKLPSEIGDLRSLLILDLRVLEVVLMLPNVLWRIKSLRQVYFPCRNFSYDSRARQGYEIEGGEKLILSNLSNLEMIEDVDLDEVEVEGLLELTGMRKLAASCVHNKESLVPFLNSSSIKSLHLKLRASLLIDHPMILSSCHFLHFLHIDDEKHEYHNLHVPINIGMFPQNLIELGFWYCQISEECISILEKLPRLKSFQLHIAYEGRKLHFSSKGFPEVTHLIIDGLWHLTEWTVEKGGLPKLKELEIYFSPLQRLPDVLSQEVTIICKPCVEGVERYGTCPYSNNRETRL